MDEICLSSVNYTANIHNWILYKCYLPRISNHRHKGNTQHRYQGSRRTPDCSHPLIPILDCPPPLTKPTDNQHHPIPITHHPTITPPHLPPPTNHPNLPLPLIRPSHHPTTVQKSDSHNKQPRRRPLPNDHECYKSRPRKIAPSQEKLGKPPIPRY